MGHFSDNLNVRLSDSLNVRVPDNMDVSLAPDKTEEDGKIFVIEMTDDDGGGGGGRHDAANRTGSTAVNQPLLNGLRDEEASSTFVVGTEKVTPAVGSPASMKSDPWALPEQEQDTSPAWNELDLCGKLRRVFVQGFGKVIVLLVLLYLFVCSLDFLSSAFRLLGGRAAGAAFSNSELLNNPVAGLMIGVLATVLVQSSSTSTSIVVTMVASGILGVRTAIPIIMGANIGTSVTNTIVSLAQSPNREEFRRAFGGATVHDMFNWLAVIILLPLEVASGYLFHLTDAIVGGFNLENSTDVGAANNDMLKTITKPFTSLVIQLDKDVIEGIAVNDPKCANKRLMKVWCKSVFVEREVNVTEMLNVTVGSSSVVQNVTSVYNRNVSVPLEQCSFLFNKFGLNDTITGLILLILSLTMLCSCLVLMVKVLNSALRGRVMTVVKRAVNSDLPGPLKYFSGYVAMIVGATMTIVVQSSSVFTSALTPLVGVGVVSLERMYPLTLGSNIGTTTTGLLAAMTASREQLRPALQIALVHLCFNVTGILLFYPIPAMRVPIRLAKMMGNTTAKYRWFAVLYVVLMFFLLPMLVFVLSMIHVYLMISVVSLFLFVLLFVVVVNVLQRRRPGALPRVLRSWRFLPLFLRSLAPLDRKISCLTGFFSRACCCRHCCQKHEAVPLDDDVKPDDDAAALGPIYRPASSQSLRSNGTAKSLSATPTVILYRDCESGYASMTTTPFNTPAHTPCISRLPSFAVVPIPECRMSEEEDHQDETNCDDSWETDEASATIAKTVARLESDEKR